MSTQTSISPQSSLSATISTATLGTSVRTHVSMTSERTQDAEEETSRALKSLFDKYRDEMNMVQEGKWVVFYGHFQIGNETFFLVVANSGRNPRTTSADDTDIFCGSTLKELDEVLQVSNVSDRRLRDWIRSRASSWSHLRIVRANWLSDR